MRKPSTFTTRAALLAGLAGLLPVSTNVLAHGYIEFSRSKLCAEGRNGECGAIQFEPQSVEGPDGFPQAGPPDGQLAGAGSAAWAELDVQSALRWSKAPIMAGGNSFKWTFTANHITRDFQYFITKPGWDPSQPLSRAQFDLEPFCVIDGNNQQTNNSAVHECDVPERDGYAVILSAWDVGDSDQAFYSTIDVLFDGSASAFGAGGMPVAGGEEPEQPVDDGGDTDIPEDDTPPPEEPPEVVDAPDPQPPEEPQTPATPVVADGGGSGEEESPPAGNGFVDVGDLHPAMELKTGDIIRLRPFAEDGELFGQSYDYLIENDELGLRENWAYEFAIYVNSQGGGMRLGMLDPDTGEIMPMRGHNDVYADPASGIVRGEIEFVIAEGNGTPEPEVPTAGGDEPAEDAPAEPDQAEEPPVTEAPDDEGGGDGVPVAGAPVEETPVEEAPVDDAPVAQPPEEEAPADPAPVDEPPVEEAPTDDEPGSGPPVDEAPGDEDPVDESGENDGDTGGGETEEPILEPSPEMEPDMDGIPEYPDDKGDYSVGSKVTGWDGYAYECVNAEFCNDPSFENYAPGCGLAWPDAWRRL